MSTDTKPSVVSYFYDHYFLPVSKEQPDLTVPEVLDIAMERAPFRPKISVTTIYEHRKKRGRN